MSEFLGAEKQFNWEQTEFRIAECYDKLDMFFQDPKLEIFITTSMRCLLTAEKGRRDDDFTPEHIANGHRMHVGLKSLFIEQTNNEKNIFEIVKSTFVPPRKFGFTDTISIWQIDDTGKRANIGPEVQIWGSMDVDPTGRQNSRMRPAVYYGNNSRINLLNELDILLQKNNHSVIHSDDNLLTPYHGVKMTNSDPCNLCVGAGFFN